MKKAFLITACALFLGIIAKGQKLNDYQLTDTTKLFQNLGQFKLDTSLEKLNSPLKSLNNKITFDNISVLQPGRTSSITISPVDHMPVVALASADRMPVKRSGDDTRYNMPIKRSGTSAAPLARP